MTLPDPGRRLLLAAALLFTLVFGCEEKASEASPGAEGSAAPPAAEPEPIRVGIAIPSYVHAVAWIGEDRGHFRKAGLDPEVTVTGGSAAAMRVLIAESIDVALAGGDAVVKANRAGADLVVVGGLVDRFYHRLVVREAIQTGEDLKGKTIGLPFLGGPQDMAVKQALSDLGLEYGKDVKVLSLGKELNRMAALKKGDIDATTSQTPDGRLKELGMRVLADLPKSDVRFPYMVVAVRRPFLTDHRSRLERVLEALCAATTDYKTHEEDSLAVIGKYLSNDDTKGAAAERYRSAGPHLLAHPPAISKAAFETLERLGGFEAAAIAKSLDGSVLEAVQKRGACK